MTVFRDRPWLPLVDQIILAKAFGSLQGRCDPGPWPIVDQSFSVEVERYIGRQGQVHGARVGGGGSMRVKTKDSANDGFGSCNEKPEAVRIA